MIDLKLLQIARKNLETCLEFREPRMAQIKKYEDMYQGKTKPALKGRFNIPVPILEGFVQTLQSKIDDQIRVEFKRGREATLKVAKKLTAAWERDSASDRGDFNGADLDAKSLAVFSGFGVLKLVPSANPYRQDLMAIDYHDVIFEPYGGRDLEKHLFKGQLNIFKTKQELVDGDYDQDGVTSLINNQTEAENKKVQEEVEGKSNRFMAMGLSPKNYTYVGTDIYNLTEMVLKYKGEDWYLLFNYEKNIGVRAMPLKEMFSSGLSPWVAWHTERNPVNFLCRAPVDGIYPIAEAMRILINQNFDNIQKRNWDMVLYNARKILDPSQFEYRPNGLIRVKLEAGESMQSAYEKMRTPDTSTITINLLQFLDNFIGMKTGITPGAQGSAGEDKVGIYYGNLKQIADRFGLFNKFYKQSHLEIAKRYKPNLADFMPSRGFMVKFIGLLGLQEEELTKKELKEELSVSVVSQNVEAQNDEMTRKKQQESLLTLIKDPELKARVGKGWILKEVLRIGEYSEDQTREALSGEEGGDAELMAEAARAIEVIEEGEMPKLNRGANTAFIRKIALYAIDNADDDRLFWKLFNYAVQHIKIAEQNAQLIQGLAAVGQQPAGEPIEQTPMAPQGLPQGIPVAPR